MRVLGKNGKLDVMNPKQVDPQKMQVLLVVEANYSELEALFEIGYVLNGSRRGALVLVSVQAAVAA